MGGLIAVRGMREKDGYLPHDVCGHGALDHMALPTTGSDNRSNFICTIRPARYFQTADRGKVVARFLVQFAYIIGMFLR